jgi:hypothetical protein
VKITQEKIKRLDKADKGQTRPVPFSLARRDRCRQSDRFENSAVANLQVSRKLVLRGRVRDEAARVRE